MKIFSVKTLEGIVLEKAGNGEFTRNIYGSTLIAREDSSDKAFYSYDGHGDVGGLFVQGVLRARYEYDAFGNTKSCTEARVSSLFVFK